MTIKKGQPQKIFEEAKKYIEEDFLGNLWEIFFMKIGEILRVFASVNEKNIVDSKIYRIYFSLDFCSLEFV